MAFSKPFYLEKLHFSKTRFLIMYDLLFVGAFAAKGFYLKYVETGDNLPLSCTRWAGDVRIQGEVCLVR